jgi:ABC-type nitrate/sulfonate/bicarbonate transport system substrate-binding protein
MKGSSKTFVTCVAILLLIAGGAALYKYWPFDFQPTPDQTISVPFIFWGGDVATFHANGNLETQPKSIFDNLGLKVKLTAGDNFDQQVKDYLSNKSPFLRGTMSMLGQVSDQLTANPKTTPVVFLQLTWSAGDHLVGRESFATLNNLKGKTIALQKGGPHVGMLNDILNTTKLTWKDVKVVWTEEVSGDKGPAELFRKDNSIDACFAISPDMTDLCGGLDDIGKGGGKSIKGAHVVVSTAHMSRSIADVYAVRKDFYDKYKGWVAKFAAGYIKGSEEVVAAKKKAGDKWAEGAGGADYRAMIKLAQDIWGQDKSLKDNVAKAEDVDGLISDATFVGLPGNEIFFTKQGNLSGFKNKMDMALKLPDDPAKDMLKNNPKPFEAGGLNYADLRRIGNLTGKALPNERFAAEIKIEPEKTIYSFEIYFKGGQHDFDVAQYGTEFQRALEQASLFGNAVVAIQGHADIYHLVNGFEKAALEKGLIKRGEGDEFIVTADNSMMKLTDIKKILKLVESNELSVKIEGENVPLKTQAAYLQELSEARAKEVRTSVDNYAKARGLVLDSSQIRSRGVGATDPADPRKEEQFQAANRRVVFSIIRVPPGMVESNEFGF